MLWIILGFCALLAGLGALRAFSRADPKVVAKWVRYMGAGVLLAVAAAFAIRGNLLFAAPLAGWGLMLLRQQLAPSQHGSSPAGSPPPRPRSRGMSREEALEILGLQAGANEDEVREAHRRLMQACHPDRGGSNYLAARLNAAKDVLVSS